MDLHFKNYLKIPLVLLDISMLNISFITARLYFDEKIPSEYFNAYLLFWLFLNTFWLLLSFLFGTYADQLIINFESFAKRTGQIFILWMISILFYLFFSRSFEVSRFFIVVTIISFSFGLFLNRFLYLGFRSYFRKRNDYLSNVIILGYNDTAKKLADYFEEEGINTNLLGFVEDRQNITELTHHPILSEISNTIQVAKKLNVQEIFTTIMPEQNKFIYTIMHKAEMECIRLRLVPNLSLFFSKPVVIDFIKDLPVLSFRSEPLEDVRNRIKKRILDVVVSLFVIIFILSWLIPLVGLLILLESKGPVFFSQLRSGKNNKTFYCLKFRSMRVNDEANEKQATLNDCRVTKVGRFLRRTSLDEFPQFINVLKGEMSLVGPRPHMVKHTSDYSKIVDQFMIRHFLKPGITGWAQINNFRGEIKNPEQIRLRVRSDLWYLENWNIWLDIRIMFLTIYHICIGDKNAY